jgi:hypothetical protein
MKAAPFAAMKVFAAVLAMLLLTGAALAQNVRGVPDDQATARKPDLTAGGGNSSVGATKPSLPEAKKERFEVLDLDGDERISLAEAAGHEELVLHFDRADRNRDGKLTLAEFQNLGKKPQAKKKDGRRPKATARTGRAPASTSGTSAASMP